MKREPPAYWLEQMARKIISNPTQAMRTTFESLPLSHQWMLFALLDCSDWLEQDEFVVAYENLCPPEHAGSSDRIIEELSESFLRVSTFAGAEGASVDWNHPTWRDLTTQILAGHHGHRQWFLKHCRHEGLRTAFAVAAGALGDINLPLLRSKEDWALLQLRFLSLPPATFLPMLAEPATLLKTDYAQNERLRALLIAMCARVIEIKRETRHWTDLELQHFLKLEQALSLRFFVPGLADYLRRILKGISNENLVYQAEASDLAKDVGRLAEFCRLQSRSLRFAWRHFLGSECLSEALDKLSICVENIIEGTDLSSLKTTQVLRSTAEEIDELLQALVALERTLQDEYELNFTVIIRDCRILVGKLRDKAYEDEELPDPKKYDDFSDDEDLTDEEIDQVFADL